MADQRECGKKNQVSVEDDLDNFLYDYSLLNRSCGESPLAGMPLAKIQAD
jgi:hypothetical protein